MGEDQAPGATLGEDRPGSHALPRTQTCRQTDRQTDRRADKDEAEGHGGTNRTAPTRKRARNAPNPIA